MLRLPILTFAVLTTTASITGSITGCGSGGSDSSAFGGTAFVSVSASPNLIDVGDQTFVKIEVGDISNESFFLKVRFPPSLSYIAGTSFIEVDGKDVRRDPERIFYNEDERKNYLIYFLEKAEIDNEKDTRVTLNLVGEERLSSGKIEVDPDIDNPNIPNNEEFDPANPQFGAETETDIEVN
jgi:hypothetical protein